MAEGSQSAPARQESAKAGANRKYSEPVCQLCPGRWGEFCAGVDDPDLWMLSAISTHLHLVPGQTLVAEGDSAEFVYIVMNGTLTLSRHSTGGRRQIFAFLFSGRFVGFSADTTYRFDVEALTESEVCRFDRRKLELLIATYPNMEKRFLQIAAKTLEDAHNLVFTLGMHNATERVAAFLLYLRAMQPDAESYSVPMMRADIADYLGLTIETVSRVLTRLRENGLIKFRSLHRFEILNQTGLRAVAGLGRPRSNRTGFAAGL